MTSRSLKTTVALGALAAAIAAAPIASAQYTNDPFFNQTVLLSQAIGFELALQRLFIVDNVPAPYDREFGEVVENLVGPDWERFAGTLAALDDDLADELYDILSELAEAVEDGYDVSRATPIARDLLNRAYDLVVPPEIRNEPAFKAAVMAQLLLGEGGVAEGLEEAFEEKWEFANGWGATQRIKVLWEDLRSLATADQQEEIALAIAEFDRIYPSPYPPESLAGVDPEEGETPAQRMVGILETVVDAQLYSGRDQLRLINHLIEIAGPGCVHYEAGEDALGREVMYAVFDHYAGETTGLGDLVGLFAPEVHDETMEAFEHLVIVEEDDDDDDESGSGSSGDDDDDEHLTPAAACEEVIEGLEAARAIFGG